MVVKTHAGCAQAIYSGVYADVICRSLLIHRINNTFCQFHAYDGMASRIEGVIELFA